MVVTVDDIVDQLWSENKRLMNELLFANKCLKILDELKTELNLIYNKFWTQLITEDTFNHLRHQLNYICDQRRDKGLHLNDVNLDENNEQRCKSKTTMNDISSDDMNETQDFDIDLEEDIDEENRQNKTNQVMDNRIQLNDNIRREENIVEINKSNNTEIIANEAKNNNTLSKDKDILKHQSNNKTINLSMLCNKKDNIIEYKCLDCDNKFLTRNALTDHMFNSHKKRLVFQDNCINQQNIDLQTKNNTNNDLMAKNVTKSGHKIISNQVKKRQSNKKISKEIVSKVNNSLIRKDSNVEEIRNKVNLNNHKTNDKTVNNSILLINNIMDPNLIYKCFYCQKKFISSNLLIDHMFSDHKNIMLLEVNPSTSGQQISSSQTKSQTIIGDKNNSKINKNEESVTTNQQSSTYRRPVSYLQSKPGGYKCLNSECQQKFKSIREYCKHQSTYVVTCPQCGKKYRSQRSYVNHQKKEHGVGGELPYKCDYIGCNYRTAELYAIRNHRSVTHSNKRPFVCNFDGCGKLFKTTSGLYSHRATHSEKKYICNADGCHKRFKSKKQYGRHLAGHMSEPTLKCPDKDCRQLFYTDREIYRHRIDDHKRKYRQNRKRLYKRCDWPGCDYYGLGLKIHKTRHTGEKNFACDWPECGKRFVGKFKLIEHMNIHNNVKPFACRWPGCEYRCANHSNISKHIKQVHKKQ
ncbi:zinc finger protein 91-like [Oppia nitens]|uniref:zinc finger protein 91-like n=1 Tax=Oppia nitens TaxID=1686743 RepID=UPI0023D9CD0D|nr:zinc finger protein 91-like [Oppia nitens]